jgi:hypothetical protein
MQTLEAPFFALHNSSATLVKKIRIVVALLFFFKVVQEVVDHRIRHANVEQTKKCNTFLRRVFRPKIMQHEVGHSGLPPA